MNRGSVESGFMAAEPFDLRHGVTVYASQAWLSSSLGRQLTRAFSGWLFFSGSDLPFDHDPNGLLLILEPELTAQDWLHLTQFRAWNPESFWLMFTDSDALLNLSSSAMLVNATTLPMDLLQPQESLICVLTDILQERQLQQSLTSAFEQSNQSLREHWLQMRLELQAGQELQRRLFPKAFLSWPPFEFAHFLQPCHFLSGDFVDYFQLSESMSMGILADVSGHGVSSAMVTMLLKTELSYLRQQYLNGRSNKLISLQELVAHLNTELLSLSLSKHVTLFVFLLDRDLGEFHYINAAHLPLPLIRVNQQLQSLPVTGMAVGLMANQSWRQKSLAFDSLELFACSDGVLDALLAEGQLAKEAMLSKILATQTWQMPELLACMQGNMSGQIVDDITILLLRDTRL